MILLWLLLLFPTAHSLNSTQSARESRFKRVNLLLKHGKLSAPDIIKSRGYPVEVHHVLTEDGYILEMHRIPGPRLTYKKYDWSRAPGRGRVVYIQHCVLCSSADFVLNDPHEAISFVLADAGFDVWLGNYRGNVYSRRHISLSPEETPFWKFSFMEMAMYDIPAMIYYILEKTGMPNLSYIGHSMGTTGLFTAISMKPELNRKIRVMAAMAPVVYLENMKGPMRQLFLFSRYSYRFYEKLNKAEVLTRSNLQTSLARSFCRPDKYLSNLCQSFLPAFTGVNKGYISPDYLPVVLAHIPAGTSSRTLAHLGQLVDGTFTMFDMGPKENLIAYGRKKVPHFDIKRTIIPVGLFWAENDFVAVPEDVARVARELPNVVYNFRVPQDDFNHFDFLFSETAPYVLYEPLVRFLLAY